MPQVNLAVGRGTIALRPGEGETRLKLAATTEKVTTPRAPFILAGASPPDALPPAAQHRVLHGPPVVFQS